MAVPQSAPIKTSMLQDLERGRPMEIDALLSAVQELGRLTGRPTPTIDTVLALVASSRPDCRLLSLSKHLFH